MTDSLSPNVGSVPLELVQADNHNTMEELKLKLPSQSAEERCERLVQDMRRFNTACREDDRRYGKLTIKLM